MRDNDYVAFDISKFRDYTVQYRTAGGDVYLPPLKFYPEGRTHLWNHYIHSFDRARQALYPRSRPRVVQQYPSMVDCFPRVIVRLPCLLIISIRIYLRTHFLNLSDSQPSASNGKPSAHSGESSMIDRSPSKLPSPLGTSATSSSCTCRTIG